jgi:hypothetical protein
VERTPPRAHESRRRAADVGRAARSNDPNPAADAETGRARDTIRCRGPFLVYVDQCGLPNGLGWFGPGVDGGFGGGFCCCPMRMLLCVQGHQCGTTKWGLAGDASVHQPPASPPGGDCAHLQCAHEDARRHDRHIDARPCRHLDTYIGIQANIVGAKARRHFSLVFQ